MFLKLALKSNGVYSADAHAHPASQAPGRVFYQTDFSSILFLDGINPGTFWAGCPACTAACTFLFININLHVNGLSFQNPSLIQELCHFGSVLYYISRTETLFILIIILVLVLIMVKTVNRNNPHNLKI